MTTALGESPVPSPGKKTSRTTQLVVTGIALVLAAAAFGGGYLTAGLSTKAPMKAGVDLSEGAHMTYPVGDDGSVEFDVSLPPIPEGHFVSIVGWHAADAYWELVANSNEVFIQWSTPTDSGLEPSKARLDDGSTHHIVIDARSPVRVSVDKATWISLGDGMDASPITDLVAHPAGE